MARVTIRPHGDGFRVQHELGKGPMFNPSAHVKTRAAAERVKERFKSGEEVTKEDMELPEDVTKRYGPNVIPLFRDRRVSR